MVAAVAAGCGGVVVLRLGVKSKQRTLATLRALELLALWRVFFGVEVGGDLTASAAEAQVISRVSPAYLPRISRL